MNKIIISKSYNPYKNLALEKYLVETNEGKPVLFLWQNENTVVIGKNQNAYEEINIDIVKKNSISVARRITGGGAVYHHLGNLNFSFILPKSIFSIDRQLQVILDALSSLSIKAEFSGRNDLLCNGRKFSGNAFLISETSLHHGTLLVNENMNIIQQVLNVKPSKLLSKGVKSIKARIMNLSQINPNLTVPLLVSSLISAFEGNYGAFIEQNIPEDNYLDYISFFSSNDWIYGKSPTYNLHKEGFTSVGQFDFFILLKDDIIKDIKVYSDSLDETLPFILENRFLGVKFDSLEMASALMGAPLPTLEIQNILF